MRFSELYVAIRDLVRTEYDRKQVNVDVVASGTNDPLSRLSISGDALGGCSILIAADAARSPGEYSKGAEAIVRLPSRVFSPTEAADLLKTLPATVALAQRIEKALPSRVEVG